MAKNILIFFPHQLKSSFGGPYTYLYHLKRSFKSKEVNLTFLGDLIPIKEETIEAPQNSTGFKQILKLILPEKIIYSYRIKRYLRQKFTDAFLKDLQSVDFSVYDAIHFHESIDIWRSQNLLKGFKGKIILMSHSPKPYHLELLEDVFLLKKKDITAAVYQALEEIDTVAFSKTDVIVAPCKEALEAYQQQWPRLENLLLNKEKVYIPTGLEVVNPSKTSERIKAELNIGADAFVICFNGRHSAVKGYDLLVAAAKNMLREMENIYFLVTGKKDEPPLIKHDRWIETGWTAEAQNYVNAAHVIAVPNRESYFDLNVLLALSLGKPLILSSTGGNQYFKKFSLQGLIYMENVDEETLIKCLREAYLNRNVLPDSKTKILKVFEQHFSIHLFAENYHQFYLSI